MEWEGLLRKLVHFRLNPLHSPPIILFYPNKPKWKFCLVMSFPRCLYLFQYYLLNCMMLACINIWIRWDGDGQMNGKIWWKPTSSSNNRELWKYLYIMGVYLVLASCLFFFASSPILAIRWQRSKCLIGLWQGLERFPCHLYHLRSPAVSSSSSSVNMVASAYIKKLWWSCG